MLSCSVGHTRYLVVSAGLKKKEQAEYPEEFTSALDNLLRSGIVVQVGPDGFKLAETITEDQLCLLIRK